MRIIQALGWYVPDSLGGTEVYVMGLCRRLRSAGHHVSVAAPAAGAPAPSSYEHDGVKVLRYPIPALPSREECQGSRPVRGAEHFRRFLLREKADVVHFHTFVTGLGLAEAAAAKTSGARVIVTTHSSSLGYICQRGTMMRWGERVCDGLCRPAKCAACVLQSLGLPKFFSTVLGALPGPVSRTGRDLSGRLGTALAMHDLISRNQAMQREMLTTVDRFVLLTQWALDAAAQNGAPREKLVLNRLGFSQRSSGRKPGPAERPTVGPIRVGYLGRFEAVKGVHDLARAAASLPSELPLEVEFRGPVRTGEERRVLAELRALTGHGSRVRFAGAVSPDDVLAVLAGYDVLCCPSVSLEGGPTVAIEAFAAGTPVVGTRIGGLAEMVTDGVNGRLVPPCDWRALAGVLRAVALDPAGTIDRWRGSLPPARTMDEIATDYLSLYVA